MKKFIALLLAGIVLTFFNTSCSEEKEPVNYGEVLSGQWSKSTRTDDFTADVSITLRSTYTCTYSQTISVDDEKIYNTLSGEWQYNEENNRITLTLTDTRENTHHEQIGIVNIKNNTITIDNNVFKR